MCCSTRMAFILRPSSNCSLMILRTSKVSGITASSRSRSKVRRSSVAKSGRQLCALLQSASRHCGAWPKTICGLMSPSIRVGNLRGRSAGFCVTRHGMCQPMINRAINHCPSGWCGLRATIKQSRAELLRICFAPSPPDGSFTFGASLWILARRTPR